MEPALRCRRLRKLNHPRCAKTRYILAHGRYHWLAVGSGNSVRALHHFAGHGHKLFQAGARNNDRVTSPMRFLRDPHETASFVFPEFNVEMLAFDLEFFRDNYVIHDDLEGGDT
jgi:hypothetical protein